MVSFLKVIFIIFAIFWFLGLVGRYLLPFLLKRFITKMTNRFEEQNNFSNKRPDGEVIITGKSKNKGNSLQGEYVDFEEVKD